jgi:hypothetical protein
LRFRLDHLRHFNALGESQVNLLRQLKKLFFAQVFEVAGNQVECLGDDLILAVWDVTPEVISKDTPALGVDFVGFHADRLAFLDATISDAGGDSLPVFAGEDMGRKRSESKPPMMRPALDRVSRFARHRRG